MASVKTTTRMPALLRLTDALVPELGEDRCRSLFHDALLRYLELKKSRPVPEGFRLRIHYNRVLLPPLALYQSLQATGVEGEQAVDMVTAAMTRLAQRSKRSLQLAGRLPFFFTFLRLFVRPLFAFAFPGSGWRIEWQENSRNQVALNFHRCYYFDLLKSYGAPELTPAFCNLDDLMLAEASPHLKWERCGTLGRGDDLCDFTIKRSDG
jgi:hypothetical protein